MKCSIIIPCYKEAENLKNLLPKIHVSMTQASQLYEVIIVDDNSQDGTETVVEEMAKSFPVTLLIRKNERGLSSAVIYGMNCSKGDILVCMDGDMSHNPKYLPTLIAPLINEASCDFVLGSRFTDGGKIDKDWSFYRHLNSKVATTLCRPLINKAITDPMSGFFALKKETFMNAAHLAPLGYKIGLELLIKCHCQKIIEVPIHFDDRLEGESKLNTKEQINYLTHLVHLYDHVYPRLAPIIKFSLTFLLGLFFSFILLVTLQLNLIAPKHIYIFYAPFIVTHLVLYILYYSYSKKIRKYKHPALSFIFVSIIEMSCVYLAVQSFPDVFVDLRALSILIFLGAIGRFIGRKIVKHDLKPGMFFGQKVYENTTTNKRPTCSLCQSQDCDLPFGQYNKWLTRCSKCSIWMAFPQPSDQELAEIYNQDYFQEWGVNKSSEALLKMKTHTFKRIINRASKYRKINKCLDFGCGLGYVLDAGQRMNLDMYGIEQIKNVVEEINKRHPDKISCGDHLNNESPNDFDMLSLYDVIEHVRDPLEVLSQLKHKLNHEGLLSITTIDKNSIWSRIMGHKWFHIHKAHLWYFDKTSLSQLCEKAGYKVLYIRRAEKIFTLRYILGILKEKSGIKLLRVSSSISLKILPRYFLDWSMPPLGEGIECLAQKKLS